MARKDRASVHIAHEAVLSALASTSDPPLETTREHPTLRRLREARWTLWLAADDADAAAALWDRAFEALTVAPAVVRDAVRTGTYDALLRETAGRLRAAGADDPAVELAFVVTALHALRLARRFGARVAVGLPPGEGDDIEAPVAWGRRLAALGADRLIVKVPLSAVGLIAAGRLAAAGFSVAVAWVFSARQAVLAGLSARAAYVEVTLDPLRQVAADNGLGDGRGIGPKVLQSIRDALGDLPTAAAAAVSAPEVAQELEAPADPRWTRPDDPDVHGFDALWTLPSALTDAAARPAARDIGRLTGDDLRGALADAALGDLLPSWNDDDLARARANGAVPVLSAWRYRLAGRRIGLDALLTFSAVTAAAKQWQALDQAIRRRLEGP